MFHQTSERSGKIVRQSNGYSAFIPNPLPPNPPIEINEKMMRLLSEADRALGRLDGVATVLPDPNLFVAMYVLQEAVLSSQIEGTQSTLEDVLEFEAGVKKQQQPKDVEEVVNYVRAMNHGLARLKDLPLSLRLIREIHSELLTAVRGQYRSPGEFRKSQNWIGPANCTLSDASFVPPPPQELMRVLGDWETFLHTYQSMPALIHCGLTHGQFETIHPFLDGNGRVGRLLITFQLCERKILSQPLLYLSYYFRLHRREYYDRLTAVRSDGDWEGWLCFFLKGVAEISNAATGTARAIISLQEQNRKKLTEHPKGGSAALQLLKLLYKMPVLSVPKACKEIGVSYVTASNAMQLLEGLGVVKETTGQRRNRVYRYDAYLALFDKQNLTDFPENNTSTELTTKHKPTLK